MFNPRELEGDVDHSFFDSDGGDDGSISTDVRKKEERGSEAEKVRLPVSAYLHARHSQNQTEARVDGGEKNPQTPTNPQKQGDANQVREAEEKVEESYGSDLEDASRPSSVSSVSGTSDKSVKSVSDAEDVSSVRSKSSSKSDLALSAEDKEVDDDDDDEDGYHQSQDESDEDKAAPPSRNTSGLRGGKVSTPKKLVRKRQPRSPSPPSSVEDTYTETESSDGRSDESCTSEPPILSRPKTSLPSSSPRVRKPVGDSAGAGERPPTPTEESEDTVTDVTPLSTPDISPFRSFDLICESGSKGAENGRIPEQTQQERAPSSGLSNIPQEDEGSELGVDESSLSAESPLGSELIFPRGRNRKNYSFSNDEVRRIDRENQRLLRELSCPSSKARPGSCAGRRSDKANAAPPIRLYHSALNRQREQQRIDRENLAFLKRLESVKPSPGLRRSDQLADYQRQAGYLGTGPLSVSRSHSSRTSSGKGSRPTTAAHRSTTPTSAAGPSASKPLPRSNKASVPRPAWC